MRMFDLPEWSPAWTFHPLEIRKHPAEPLLLEQGDSVDVSCTWNNTENRTLAFGSRCVLRSVRSSTTKRPYAHIDGCVVGS